MSEVDGRPCHHLAFGQEHIDWQLWIEDGDRPLPRKLVVIYKNDPGVPRYTVRLTRSTLEDELPDEGFEAVIPEESTPIEFLDQAGGTTPDAGHSSDVPQKN